MIYCKSLFSLMFLLSALPIFVGCSSFSSNTRADGEVIERSKQSRPIWVDAPSGQLIINGDDSKVHVELLRQPDLPIAIKQAQARCIEASFSPWIPTYEARLSDFSVLTNARNARNSQEFNDLSEHAARKIHAKVARVEDIYYERIRLSPDKKPLEFADVTEYFDVHVLVQINKIASESMQATLALVFSQAKDRSLQNAGKALATNKSQPSKNSKIKK